MRQWWGASLAEVTYNLMRASKDIDAAGVGSQGQPTCKGAARAMGMVAGLVGSLVDCHLTPIVEDIDDSVSISLFLGDRTVLREGQMAPF